MLFEVKLKRRFFWQKWRARSAIIDAQVCVKRPDGEVISMPSKPYLDMYLEDGTRIIIPNIERFKQVEIIPLIDPGKIVTSGPATPGDRMRDEVV